MKKLFIIASIFFAVIGLVTGRNEVTAIAAFGIFAFSHDWSKNNPVLASFVPIYPAQITDVNGRPVPMWTRCQKYLAEYLKMYGNVVTKDALAAGSIIWNPITYYIRYVITGLSGRQTILQASTVKTLGITNLDKGQLPQYYNFCFDRIAVRYATTATATDSPINAAGFTSVRSSMPVGLQNGELIVSLNDQKQIESPISDFTSNAAITGGGSRDFDGGELQVPKVWQENLQIKVELNLPVVMPSTANNTYFVEANFYGIEARLS